MYDPVEVYNQEPYMEIAMMNKEMMRNVLVEMDQYTEILKFNNFFGKSPKEFIEIFATYGGMLYSREEYLWRLAYLLSVEYSTENKEYVGAYHMAPIVNEGIYIDTYRHIEKIQKGEPINWFFELDKEINVARLQCATYKSLKTLSREELYTAAENIFFLYIMEEETNPSHDEWEDFIRRLKFSHQRENFNLSAMLGAIALCTEYGNWVYWNSYDRESVMAIYKKLKSHAKRDRRSTNIFLHVTSNFGEDYHYMWKSAR